jgi:hypothetical protein
MAKLAIDPFEWVIGKTTAVDYKRWFIKFESILQFNKIKPAEQRDEAVALLLACGGTAIVDTISNKFDATQRSTKSYKEYKDVLDDRFLNQNERVARLVFMQMKQQPNEKLTELVQRIYPYAQAAKMEENEVFITQLALMLDDSPISTEIREKIMENKSLNEILEWYKAKDVENELSQMKINAVKQTASAFRASNNKFSRPHQQYSYKNNSSYKCQRCNRPFPHRGPCPAKGKQCNKCNKFDHFAICCGIDKAPHVRKMQRIENFSTGSESNVFYQSMEAFNTEAESIRRLNINLQQAENIDRVEVINIKTVSSPQTCPKLFLNINGVEVQHVADTGAGINVMSSFCFDNDFSDHNRPKLQPTKALLKGYNANRVLPTIGEFETVLSINGITKPVRYVVVKSDTGRIDNLLGYRTLIDFNMVTINEVVQSFRIANLSDKPKNINDTHITEAIARKEFPTLFEDRVGKIPNVELKIRIDKHAVPKQRPAYRTPFHLQPATKAKLDFMLENDLIGRVPQNWDVSKCFISPMHPVDKTASAKSNKKLNKLERQIRYDRNDIRITSDNTDVNAAIIKQPRLMPCTTSLKYALNNKKFFSKLDIKDAFNTMVLDESSQKLTIFATEWGLFHYKRLNMGLCVASELFQATLSDKLADLINIKVAMDDILVYGETQQEHNIALRSLLERLVELNLTLSQKSVFCKNEVEFYGMVISEKGIKPKVQKMDDFLNAAPPSDSKTLKSFIGLAKYFADRIPKHAILFETLRELEKPGVKFEWLEKHQSAFLEIKKALITTSLDHFDITKQTEVWVDAGPTGISAFLVQSKPNDTSSRSLIACASRPFNKIEKGYNQLEKEAFACLWACEHFHIYVYGTKFNLLTDNKAVSYILSDRTDTKRKTPLRVRHWRSRLVKYHGMTPLHVKGTDNIADYLSRCLNTNTQIHSDNITEEDSIDLFQISLEDLVTDTVHQLSSSAFEYAELITATEADPQLQAVKQQLLTRQAPSKNTIFDPFRRFWDSLSVTTDGIVLRDERLIIPNSLQNKLIDFAHEGHAGIEATKRALRSRYFFQNMDKLIVTKISQCIHCQANVNKTQRSPIIPSKLPKGKFHLCSIDFSSRTPSGEYILVLVDEYSRYPIIEFSSRLTSSAAIKCLQTIIAKHGKPFSIKSDNGPAFMSKEFAHFMKTQGIVHHLITPLWPQANGMCERMMANINKSIRISKSENKPFKPILNSYLDRYRETPHKSTNHTPNELMGYKDVLYPSFTTNKSVQELNQSVKQNDAFSKQKMVAYANRHTKQRPQFVRGDTVLVKNDRPNKFSSFFSTTPYTVINNKFSMITAESKTGHKITRNESHFKKFNIPEINVYSLQDTLTFTAVSALIERFDGSNNRDSMDLHILTPPVTAQNQQSSFPEFSNPDTNSPELAARLNNFRNFEISPESIRQANINSAALKARAHLLYLEAET